MLESIFAAVRLNLDLTADQSYNDDKIRGYIADGFAELKRHYPTLTEEQAENDGFIAFLLKKYVFYAYNNAVSDFKANYADDLLNLRQMYEVSAYEAEQG